MEGQTGYYSKYAWNDKEKISNEKQIHDLKGLQTENISNGKKKPDFKTIKQRKDLKCEKTRDINVNQIKTLNKENI